MLQGNGNLATIIVSAILSGTLGATVVALLKVKRENENTVVDSAQGAVIVQSSVITSLREEIDRRDKVIEQKDKIIETQRDRAEECEVEMEQLEMVHELLKKEMANLTKET